MINPIGDHTKRQYDELLACALGSCGYKGAKSTAASIVNQIDYWIDKFRSDEADKPKNQRIHYKNGKWWVFNTYAEWQTQFRFVDEKTIERIMKKLEKIGIVESGRFNQRGYDRTKWYTLNYKLIESLMQQERDKLSPCNDMYLSCSNGTSSLDGKVQAAPNNTKEYTNNNTYSSHRPECKRNRSKINGFTLMQSSNQTDWNEIEEQLIDN